MHNALWAPITYYWKISLPSDTESLLQPVVYVGKVTIFRPILQFRTSGRWVETRTGAGVIFTLV